MDLGLVLGILKEGLKYRNLKQDSKYIDRIIKLEKDYYEEFSKPESSRSQLTLDRILLELETIAKAFLSNNSRN